MKPALALSLGFIVFNASLMLHGLPGCVVPTIIEAYNLLVVYSLFREIKIDGNRSVEPSEVTVVVNPQSSEPNQIGWKLKPAEEM